jgi:hypothetical protein
LTPLRLLQGTAIHESALEKIARMAGKIGPWDADAVGTACDD